MNERDSEAVAAQLCAKGYTMAPSENHADVVLLNTCSVRDQAEQKALGKMQNLAVTLKRNRPDVVLGFMGCMAQSRGKSLVDQLPDVDLASIDERLQRVHAVDELIDVLDVVTQSKFQFVEALDPGLSQSNFSRCEHEIATGLLLLRTTAYASNGAGGSLELGGIRAGGEQGVLGLAK